MKYWSLLLLMCLPLLPGCLQIELNGPVAGAQITITPLRGGQPIIEGVFSKNVRALENTYGTAEWAGFDKTVQALLLGVVELPDAQLVDAIYYLVTAKGGLDKDGDNNAVIDDSGTPVAREIHAIMSGAQLKQSFNRVTMLSEAIYRTLEPELEELSDVEIGKRLTLLSRQVVGDVNGDRLVNYKDVLHWSNFFEKAQYKGSPELLARLPRAISDSLYTREIITSDSVNVVESARFRPAKQNTRWDDTLVGCNYPVVYGDLCDMRKLSLLGIDTDNPTTVDIMNRLVVSHTWMATRFQQVLNIMPEEIFLLFRSVTSVVIGDEIRPSFYDPLTGALYLDAGTFWLSEAERKTVSSEPDYRAEFASAVDFATPWRYVKDNRDAFASLDGADNLSNRQLEDIELDVASLLLHELAHAADNFPPGLIDTIGLSTTPLEANLDVVSDKLVNFRPLQSEALAGIADVLFFGADPTPQQANYTAEDIGELFTPDRASDLYNYFTQYEDLAMLFEEAMMEILYGIQRDIAFTSIPADGLADDDITCDDYKIGWGVRGRIAAPQVLARVKLVVSNLLPEKNFSSQLNQLKPPATLKKGRNWCDSIVLNSNDSLAPYRLLDTAPMRQRWLKPRHL